MPGYRLPRGPIACLSVQLSLANGMTRAQQRVIYPVSLGDGTCNVQVTAQSALKQLHSIPLTATDYWLPGADTIPSRIFMPCSMQLTIEFPLEVAFTCNINTCLLVLLT